MTASQLGNGAFPASGGLPTFSPHQGPLRPSYFCDPRALSVRELPVNSPVGVCPLILLLSRNTLESRVWCVAVSLLLWVWGHMLAARCVHSAGGGMWAVAGFAGKGAVNAACGHTRAHVSLNMCLVPGSGFCAGLALGLRFPWRLIVRSSRQLPVAPRLQHLIRSDSAQSGGFVCTF